MAGLIPQNPSSWAPEPTFLTKMLYVTANQQRENKAQKRRVPSDASAFRTDRLGKKGLFGNIPREITPLRSCKS